MKKIIQTIFVCTLSLLLLNACQFPNIKPNTALSENIEKTSSLSIDSGYVITDNQQSFEAKLALIEQAKESIDLVYFIVSDDYSSSVFASHLIAASQRGVKVRLLVDYVTNYSRLDWFSMLEAEGGGNLTVRFYGRPTNNMIKDAVYMTLGCNEIVPRENKNICKSKNLAQIEQLFQAEKIDGKSAESLNISNLNLAESGLFLSGLYSKNIDAMMVSIDQGKNTSLKQIIAPMRFTYSKPFKRIKHFGRMYWESKNDSDYQKVFNRLKTTLASQYYGDTLNSVYASFSMFLPTERQHIKSSARDWANLTNHINHKLLLVDQRTFMLGGRNIEDSYHMRSNPLSTNAHFIDTDILVKLKNPDQQIASRFEALWSFIRTASLAEVRQHAPNDFVANWHWANEACSKSIQIEGCRLDWLNRVNLQLEKRVALEKNKLEEHQKIYQTTYQPSIKTAKQSPVFLVNNQAVGTYLENESSHTINSRKEIHQYWLSKLSKQCNTEDKSPRDIYFYSAYFSPPPNMILAFKALIDGSQDCSHVTLNIITNSVKTTDLQSTNIFARHSIKAFIDYYMNHFDKNRSAMVRYFEYQNPENETLSLRSNVTLFEDALVIGSANLDVRSYFMDSHNALVIHNDSELIKQYQQYLIEQLNHPGLLKLKNIELYNMTLDAMVTNDRQLLQASLEKYAVQNKLSEAQHQTLIQKMEQLTTAAYQLTKQLLETHSESEQKKLSERFYQLFKTI